jgi:hypothetical protein
MIEWVLDAIEKSLQRHWVSGVKRSVPMRVQLVGGSTQPVRVTPGDHHVRTLGLSLLCRCQANARRPADHHDGLMRQASGDVA